MLVSIICAVSENRVIGRDGRLPWELPRDLKLFQKYTKGKAIVMGRRTFESIGKPLPGRQNIVISSGPAGNGYQTVRSVKRAKAICESDELVVIGGAKIYREFLPIADRMILTFVDANVQGDTRFPPFDENCWDQVSGDFYGRDESNQYDFVVCVYERKQQA